jgi:hypothetical protein
VALERGRVFHDVVKLCIDLLNRVPPSCPARLHDVVRSRLPRWLYATDDAWHADVDLIVDWVKTALTYIGEPQ